jgi:hypothetical protein
MEEQDAVFGSERYKSAPMRSYDSIKQLALATGLDVRLLKLAKEAGLPGFRTHRGVHWPSLKASLEGRYRQLSEQLAKKMELDDQIKALQVRILTAKAKREEGATVEVKEFKQWFAGWNARFRVAYLAVFEGLPVRLLGQDIPSMTLELNRAIKEIHDLTLGGEKEADELAKI